jgi:hypothetical protein
LIPFSAAFANEKEPPNISAAFGKLNNVLGSLFQVTFTKSKLSNLQAKEQHLCNN